MGPPGQISEALAPADTAVFLRGLHRLFERCASSHAGVITGFVGDGAMIVFGLPDPGPTDAAASIACGRMLLREADGRDRELRAMKEKIGDLTMANELLETKIGRLEAARSLIPSTWHARRTRLYSSTEYISPPSTRSHQASRWRSFTPRRSDYPTDSVVHFVSGIHSRRPVPSTMLSRMNEPNHESPFKIERR